VTGGFRAFWLLINIYHIMSMSPTMTASQRILPDRGGVVAVCVNQWHVLTQRSKDEERETGMIREEFKCSDQQHDHLLHKFTAAGLRLLSPGLCENAARYASASPPHHRGCTLLFHSGSTREGGSTFATSERLAGMRTHRAGKAPAIPTTWLVGSGWSSALLV